MPFKILYSSELRSLDAADFSQAVVRARGAVRLHQVGTQHGRKQELDIEFERSSGVLTLDVDSQVAIALVEGAGRWIIIWMFQENTLRIGEEDVDFIV